MNIAYIEPLTRAWNRMKTALFKPFNLNKWFVIGFTAFLAGLMDAPHGGGSSDSHGRGDFSFGEFLNFPDKAWEWLMDHPVWLIAIALIALFVIAVIITLTWLSSRGIFMFLDNVVQGKAEIKKPWKQFKKEGNSLFLWRLCFGLVCFILITGYIVLLFVIANQIYRESVFTQVPIPLIVVIGLLFLLIIIIIAYISLFLKDFVAPIMYKHNISATEAWGRFLTLLGQHPFHFILYGLFIFVLTILVFIGIVLAGIFTCCIGLLLLIIPYIGTVVTLPVWYTFRAFSLEYLSQFGENFNLFPPPETSSENTA